MALVKGTNAYASVADADAYFLDRIDSATWVSTSSTIRAQALVSAAAYLDSLEWVGQAISITQAMAFPRVAEYYEPKIGYLAVLDEDTPDRIFKANIELAYHYILNSDLFESGAAVKSIEVGPIKLDNIYAAPMVPPIVSSLIRPLLVNGGARLVWKAN